MVAYSLTCAFFGARGNMATAKQLVVENHPAAPGALTQATQRINEAYAAATSNCAAK